MTSRGSIDIYGLSFDVGAPYAEGHTLTSHEAAVLNQTRAENVSNNFRSSVKEMLEKHSVQKASELPEEAMQALRSDFSELDSEYEFGVRRGRVSDPVEAEARRIAKEALRAALSAKGVAVTKLNADQVNSLVEKYWPQYGEEWLSRARVIVDERKRAVSLDLDVGDLGNGGGAGALQEG